jgi:hypothetical protein
MMRMVIAALLALPIASCAGSEMGGSLLYLEPYRLSEMSCEDLKQRAESAARRIESSERLMAKASTDPAGPLVNTMVYTPDHHKAQWEYSVYRREAARKNCGTDRPKS